MTRSLVAALRRAAAVALCGTGLSGLRTATVLLTLIALTAAVPLTRLAAKPLVSLALIAIPILLTLPVLITLALIALLPAPHIALVALTALTLIPIRICHLTVPLQPSFPSVIARRRCCGSTSEFTSKAARR
jgi:hypothetical protein